MEIDLNRHLTGLKKFIVPLVRPKVTVKHHAKVHSFEAATSAAEPQPAGFRRSEGRPRRRLFPHRRHHRPAEGRAAQIFRHDL
jgi:hypothetical protein